MPKVSVYSGFQWSQIDLLEAISSELIFGSIIPTWIRRIETLEPTNPKIAPDELFALNVLAGFLNVYASLDKKPDKDHWENKIMDRLSGSFGNYGFNYDTLQNIQIQGFDWRISRKGSMVSLLSRLLQRDGHLLFNSYFYTLENVYGHQRFFFRELWNKHPNKGKLDETMAYFDKQRIPFRVYSSSEFAGTYSNQLLPTSAGVSGHFLNHMAKNFSDQRSGQVKYFLESMALLHKREDFIQGHNSALIHILRNDPEFNHDLKSKPFGAFILTSILPLAFGNTESRQLFKIIEGDTHQKRIFNDVQHPNRLGSLTDQYERFKLSADKFLCLEKFHDPHLVSLNDNIKLELQGIAKDNLNAILAEGDNNHLFIKIDYRLPEKSKKDISSYSFLNYEGLYHVAKMLFPTSTTVDYNLIGRKDTAKQKSSSQQIHFDQLKSYNTVLNKLFSKSKEEFNNEEEETLRSDNVLSQFISCLYPETLFKSTNIESNVIVETINYERNYRIVIFVDKSKHQLFDTTIEDLKTRVAECVRLSSNLPDGENPSFLKIEKAWISAQKSDIKTVLGGLDSDSFESELLYAVSSLMTRGVRGLLILKCRDIFLPTIVGQYDDDFLTSLQTTQSFWLFERLSSYLAAASHLYAFEGLKKTMDALYRYTLADEQAEKNDKRFRVKVLLNPGTDNAAQNKELTQILLYLGIHVHELGFYHDAEKDTRAAVSIGNKGPFHSDQIADFYKEYVRYKVLRSTQADILPAIFNKYISIKDISWQEKENRSIEMTYELMPTTGIVTKKYQVLWQPEESLELVMTALNIKDIAEAFQNNANNYLNPTDYKGESVSIRQLWTYSGEGASPKIIKDTDDLGRYRTFVEKVTAEQNIREAGLLLDLNEIFLHRSRRVNEYLNRLLRKLHFQTQRMLFTLGFMQLREVQSQLFAISRPKQSALTINFQADEVILFRKILQFYYLKNFLFIQPTKVFSYVYDNNSEEFEKGLFDSLSKVIETSQMILNESEKMDFKEFFNQLEEFNPLFEDIYNRVIKIQTESDNEIAPLQLIITDHVYMHLPSPESEIFWIYFATILDETMDNSIKKGGSLEINIDNGQMVITSHLIENSLPPPAFINAYESRSYITGNDIKPLANERQTRISFGTYGIKVACDEIGWEYGLRYDREVNKIYQRILFKQTDPFEFDKKS